VNDADIPVPEEGRITVERRGHVLLIGLDRPKKLNGLTPEMLRALAEAFTAFEADEEAWAGVLHAHGANFTAGLQLDRCAPIMARGESLFPLSCIDPMGLREPKRSKPLVAAVRGICFTAGLELMLAADIVVAGADCRFSQLEVRRGIMPTGGATIRFVERAGWGNAQRLLLTGMEFDSAEALRCGLVQEVVPPEAVLERALALAQAIAECAPLAVRASLASSRRSVELGPGAAAATLDSVQRQLAATWDAEEGVRSFVERRPAAFRGR
jgi:enoyl-CoA hydratase/carnithine racemase